MPQTPWTGPETPGLDQPRGLDQPPRSWSGPWVVRLDRGGPGLDRPEILALSAAQGDEASDSEGGQECRGREGRSHWICVRVRVKYSREGLCLFDRERKGIRTIAAAENVSIFTRAQGLPTSALRRAIDLRGAALLPPRVVPRPLVLALRRHVQ